MSLTQFSFLFVKNFDRFFFVFSFQFSVIMFGQLFAPFYSDITTILILFQRSCHGYRFWYNFFIIFFLRTSLCVFFSALVKKKLGLRSLPSSPHSSGSSSSSVSVDFDFPKFFSFFRLAAARRRAVN